MDAAAATVMKAVAISGPFGSTMATRSPRPIPTRSGAPRYRVSGGAARHERRLSARAAMACASSAPGARRWARSVAFSPFVMVPDFVSNGRPMSRKGAQEPSARTFLAQRYCADTKPSPRCYDANRDRVGRVKRCGSAVCAMRSSERSGCSARTSRIVLPEDKTCLASSAARS